MDNKEYLEKLRRKEQTILARIEKMRKTMNETVELKTLGFMTELLEEAKKELEMVQEKLSASENEKDWSVRASVAQSAEQLIRNQ